MRMVVGGLQSIAVTGEADGCNKVVEMMGLNVYWFALSVRYAAAGNCACGLDGYVFTARESLTSSE